MTVREFSFQHTRVILAGAAEVAPTDPTDAVVWDLREDSDSPTHVHADSLVLLAQGGNLAYELGFWNPTVTATASFVVVDTGTLVDGVPATIPFSESGARIYIRSTGVTAVDIRVSCAAVGGGTEALAAILAGLATEATLLTRATEATQLSVLANQTNGTQKSIVRGVAKGTTVAADITGSVVDNNHQALDVTSLFVEQAPLTLATWAAFTGDTTEPAAWIAASPIYGDIKLKFAVTSVGGTVSPTMIRFRIWGRSGTGAGAQIEKIGNDLIVAAADLVQSNYNTTITRQQYHANCDEIAVTVDFIDGTAPTITGSVYARVVPTGALLASDFQRDSAGKLMLKVNATDDLTDTIKTTIMAFMEDLYIDEPLVVDVASIAISTVYYPSSDGLEYGPHNSVGMQWSLVGAAGCTAIVTVEECIGTSVWTQVNDITEAVVDKKTLATLPGAMRIDPTYSASEDWVIAGQNGTRCRLKVVVSGNATGAFKASFRRATLITPPKKSPNVKSEVIVIQDGLAVVTANYDLDMKGWDDLTLVVYGQSDAVNLNKVAILQCNYLNTPTPRYAVVTAGVYDSSSHTMLAPDATGDVTMPVAAATQCWNLHDVVAERIRIRVTATADADNKLEIFACRQRKH